MSAYEALRELVNAHDTVTGEREAWQRAREVLAAGERGVPREPQTWWLIERGQQENHVPTIWWCYPGKGDRKYKGRWSEDANKAYKFKSRADAENPHNVVQEWDDPPTDVHDRLHLCHATEHVFLDAAPQREAGESEP